jgi:hypothetical protein
MEEENKIEPKPEVVTSEPEEGSTKQLFTKDEYHLATLGYKQEFFRSLGLFENW